MLYFVHSTDNKRYSSSSSYYDMKSALSIIHVDIRCTLIVPIVFILDSRLTTRSIIFTKGIIETTYQRNFVIAHVYTFTEQKAGD